MDIEFVELVVGMGGGVVWEEVCSSWFKNNMNIVIIISIYFHRKKKIYIYITPGFQMISRTF